MANPFKIKLSRSFIIRSYLGILVSGVMYCIILPFILNLDFNTGIDLAKKVGTTMTILGLICTTLFYMLYKPAEELILGIQNGITPPPEKIRKARKSLSRMDFYYLLIGIVFYPLGTAINLLGDYLRHAPIIIDLAISRLIAGLIWGIAVAVFTVRINSITLIQTKIMLNIYDLDNSKQSGLRYESVFRKFVIPFFFLLLLSLSFSSIFFYQVSKDILGEKDVEIKELLLTASSGELSQRELQTAAAGIEKGMSFQRFDILHYLKVISLLFFFLIIMFTIIIYEYKMHLKILIRQIDDLSSANMDLSQRINIISFDDVGIMTAGINKIIGNLLKTFSSIKDSSNEVRCQGLDAEEKIEESRKATAELGPIINSFEKNTDTQINFIRSTIDQFKDMLIIIDNSIRMIQTQIAKVANTSNDVRDMSKAFHEINKTSENNIQIFNNLITSIEEGNRNIRSSIESIQAINESGKKINEIAAIITNIASQTSLLAMNAAIEASHAGQYGKGFAVVSEEIKKLSESSSGSAQGILTIIKEMNQKIQKGSDIFTNLKGTFDLMMINMNKTRQSLNEISQSTGNHSEKALRNIDEINELLEITNQLKNETENLGRDSKNIENSISQLNTSSETLKTGNAALTGEIKNLVRISDEVSANFKAISESINELDNKISQYKTE